METQLQISKGSSSNSRSMETQSPPSGKKNPILKGTCPKSAPKRHLGLEMLKALTEPSRWPARAEALRRLLKVMMVGLMSWALGFAKICFILWMDEILHQFETNGNHCSLVFTGESSFQGFLGGAGFRPSTVWGAFFVVGH